MKNKPMIDPMYAMANGLCRICGKNVSDLMVNQPCNEEVNCLSNLPDDSAPVVSNIENVKQETNH